MFQLEEKRTFFIVKNGKLIEQQGIIVGRTHEQDAKYDFLVDREIMHAIPEENIQ